MNVNFDTYQLLAAWEDKWNEAKAIWSPFIRLREPEWCLSTIEAKKEGLSGSFAMIRLTDHRIVIDLEKINQEGLNNFALEILSHEIGHHIYSPANLHDNAILLSRIRWGLPDIEDRTPFVANLYADILINDTLQRKNGLHMADVYRKVNTSITFSKIWTFCMRTYEYLWKLEKGSLATDKSFHTPSIDADASLAASLIRSYSKSWLDGAGRFAALMYPYLVEEKEFQDARTALILYLDSENAGEGGGAISGLASIDPEGIEGAVDPRVEATGDPSKHPDIASGESLGKGDGPRQRYLNPGNILT